MARDRVRPFRRELFRCSSSSCWSEKYPSYLVLSDLMLDLFVRLRNNLKI